MALELDVAAMVAEMGPPTADDVPIALDGTRLDTPDKVIAYLEQINAAREQTERIVERDPTDAARPGWADVIGW